ncbi:alpha/beta fold hydrolase [Hymenobacter latericus]|uniref:alpha/beta fold hydrolase n=1 Tax=Hymenobacter sp. YIM 151858-1 TaxID=2987688 RepID=UPI002226C5DE|nr:alpha/beta hydrolase [Hymenobacter sp. YIM 151858-1]UYZ61056.1 alpha/beta hydrolase [Hymenobacter sp. YIM 151858-1]
MLPAHLGQLRRAALGLFLLLIFVPAFAAPADGPKPALTNGTPTITTSDGIRLFTKITGQGRPCVFIHGGPGAWSGMPETFIDPLVKDKLQMVWYDQRGSGRTPNDPNKNYSLERQIQDLEDLRQQLGLEQWLVMAHSFGGTIATEYAARYPQRVQGLVLLNCTLSLEEAMKNTVAGALPYLPAEAKAPLQDAAKSAEERFGMLMPQMKPEIWQKLQYQTIESHQKVTEADKGNPGTGEFGSYGFSLPDYRKNFLALTPQIKAPVLVVTGKIDNCVGPEHYKLFRFPNQQVAQMQTGHVPFVEEPQAVAKAIAHWLKKLPRKA